METLVQAPAWVRGTPRAGGARVSPRSGFPTTRQEDWRFTNVAPIADAKFALGAGRVRAGAVARSPRSRCPARCAGDRQRPVRGRLVGSERAAQGPAHRRPSRRRARRHRRPRAASRPRSSTSTRIRLRRSTPRSRRRRGDLRHQRRRRRDADSHRRGHRRRRQAGHRASARARGRRRQQPGADRADVHRRAGCGLLQQRGRGSGRRRRRDRRLLHRSA